MQLAPNRTSRFGHTLMEMTVAMAASGVLLAGLGSVMMIARQVAYTPSAAAHRTETADVVNQIAEELRYATLVIQQTPQVLEFVVADRDGNNTAEKIRYQWSGAPGDPLYKTVNGGTSAVVLDTVVSFSNTLQLKPKVTTLKTTTDSAEAILISNASVDDDGDRDISAVRFSAQQINPAAFVVAVPANAICWNATKVQFYGSKADSGTTLLVQLRPTGEPIDGPTGNVLGQKSIPDSALSGGDSWITATFPGPIRDLGFHRRYALAWAGQGGGNALRFVYSDNGPGGVLDSNDAGATWNYMTTRQVFYRLYGTYTTPSTNYDVTRNYVSHVRLVLQTGPQAHARIDASIPLANSPELLSLYWRSDFNANPTAINANGDSVTDWAVAGGGAFDTTKLIGGVWYATGALETRPLADFTTTTTVEARCRNTTVGGNGAVLRINADRQGGLYAPLLVYVQRQADGTQTLSVHGKTSDVATKQLFVRQKLSAEFVRFRLTVLPQYDVVNLQINDEDQGTFAYPLYAPAGTSDRYVTLYADTSLAEFDYVDVRAATN